MQISSLFSSWRLSLLIFKLMTFKWYMPSSRCKYATLPAFLSAWHLYLSLLHVSQKKKWQRRKKFLLFRQQCWVSRFVGRERLGDDSKWKEFHSEYDQLTEASLALLKWNFRFVAFLAFISIIIIGVDSGKKVFTHLLGIGGIAKQHIKF